MRRHGSKTRAGATLAWLAALLTATSQLAHAQQPLDDPKIKKADQLYDEARQLVDSNLALACQKFEESLKLNNEAIGTLINVALCDEKLGRFASAVAKYSETRDRGKEQGLAEYVRASEQHIAALAPLVPHLTVKLGEDLPGTAVVVDNQLIAPGALASIAVDPGQREIVVSAPDRLPYRTTIVVAKAEHRDVVVPALARSVVVNSSRRRIGQIVALTGAVGAATGLGIGLFARHKYNQQFDVGDDGANCVKVHGDRSCNPEGLKQTDRARTLGNVGTIVGIAGAAIAVGGVVLWLVSPRSTGPAAEHRAGVTVLPAISPDQVGLAAVGRF